MDYQGTRHAAIRENTSIREGHILLFWRHQLAVISHHFVKIFEIFVNNLEFFSLQKSSQRISFRLRQVRRPAFITRQHDRRGIGWRPALFRRQSCPTHGWQYGHATPYQLQHEFRAFTAHGRSLKKKRRRKTTQYITEERILSFFDLIQILTTIVAWIFPPSWQNEWIFFSSNSHFFPPIFSFATIVI